MILSRRVLTTHGEVLQACRLSVGNSLFFLLLVEEEQQRFQDTVDRLLVADDVDHDGRTYATHPMVAMKIPRMARKPPSYLGASFDLNNSGPLEVTHRIRIQISDGPSCDTHTMFPVALPIPYRLRQIDRLVCPAIFPAIKDRMSGLAPKRADSR